MVEEEEEEEEAVEAAAQDNAGISPAQELSVVPRLSKELGHGKRRSGQPLVLRSVEEPWFILSGLSPPLTASLVNLLHKSALGECYMAYDVF